MFAVLEISVDDGIADSPFRVRVPDKRGWAKRFTEKVENSGCVVMFDTLASGSGGCCIMFCAGEDTARSPWSMFDDGEAFGFVASRQALTELRQAIDFALAHYNASAKEREPEA